MPPLFPSISWRFAIHGNRKSQHGCRRSLFF